MKILNDSPINQVKIARATLAWQAMLKEALQRDFFGQVKMELLISDGTIQVISHTIERVDKT